MKKAFLQLHLSVFLAGFTGILGKLISLNEGLLVWYRLLITSVTLYVLFRFQGTFKKLPWKDILPIGSTGVVIALHWLFFYGSIKYSNVSIGVVCFSLTSLFTAIFDPLINRRRFDVAEMLLSMLTLLGILLIFHFDTQYRTGIILGIISAMFAALFTVFNKRLIKRFDTPTITFYELSTGFLVLSLAMPLYLHLFPAPSLLPSSMDLLYLFILAWFCTVLMYLLNMSALKKISAFTVNLCFNLEPVYSIVMAFILFHENQFLNNAFYAGLGCIILSVGLQMLRVVRGKTAS
ncbi:Threonine/homoserine efflux transporter RhtA [Chitinophaga ginsengisegetis]|uniref:Threonine/homoserine efflux transporter RhtA n=1 Tax=Chitinophaga ginsengisegetis TaxID=393003 RepID=A0A1T5NG46_9BACT|nr:DMT family transporter [Chitinophaga ginsengisegetis]MDR6569466.1 drug/metabolite transporter (DMT)-like permease [Chitinophaga ginsengisegetis]MDR6649199.1 drug/metabolite transporter (DMT)-like permease [Chitinophaga ginsengisegetis]MDR6655549.1 drug/metabolite transporter (DMT)-like permease [Chitinophaga ginsengisegetis]SKC99455.1 Threonine/homoserine efflux transporter RhtA [Chitinophaga ginsengisegetis]